MTLDLDAEVARFRFRYPDEAGMWHWRTTDTIICLPDGVRERLKKGEPMAPTLREEHRGDGSRIAVLDAHHQGGASGPARLGGCVPRSEQIGACIRY